MSTGSNDLIPEEHYVSKAWLKKYGPPPIPDGDGLKIFDPFPSNPLTTQGVPRKTKIINPKRRKRNPSTISSAKPLPTLDLSTLKKAIALLDQEQTIRFEVNQALFDEINCTIATAKDPLFALLNQRTLIYLRYDCIPIILIPDQKVALKIIKKKNNQQKEKQHENHKVSFGKRKKTEGYRARSEG